MKIQIGPITADFLRFLRILDIFHINCIQRHAKTLLSTNYLRSVSSPIGNLSLFYLIILITYGAVAFANLRNVSDSLSALDSLYLFNSILKSLVLMPIFGNEVPSSILSSSDFSNEQNWFAQVPTCSVEYLWILHKLHSLTYLIVSYLVLGTAFAIIVYEIIKEFQSSEKAQDFTRYAEEQGSGMRYKYSSGNLFPLYSTGLGESGDDPPSMDTALTPLSDIHPEESVAQLCDDGESDTNNCPIKVSANGYILRVEAIVTTV
jgi:hypothetical protein